MCAHLGCASQAVTCCSIGRPPERLRRYEFLSVSGKTRVIMMISIDTASLISITRCHPSHYTCAIVHCVFNHLYSSSIRSSSSKIFVSNFIFFFFLMTRVPPLLPFFFFNDPAPPEIYPLPLHDALPI